MIGHNFEAHSPTCRSACCDAAANLEFEEAARLRDEIKRLRETELVLADDPLARQEDVEARAGAFSRGAKPERPRARARASRRSTRWADAAKCRPEARVA